MRQLDDELIGSAQPLDRFDEVATRLRAHNAHDRAVLWLLTNDPEMRPWRPTLVDYLSYVPGTGGIDHIRSSAVASIAGPEGGPR